MFDLNYGNEYKAIGFDENGQYLVMDECYDCYFYSSTDFEVVSDPFGVLDMNRGWVFVTAFERVLKSV